MALEDEVLSRQMPHDLDAEQAVLGSMLFDAECIKDVMDKLLPEDFYLKQNRDIFTVAYNMFSFSKPIDPLTLAEEMRKSGVYDEQTTRSYLAQLVDFTFSSANVMDYVKILRDKSLLRGLSRAAGEIDTMVQEGLGEASAILEAAEQKVYAIRRGRSARSAAQHVVEQMPEILARPGHVDLKAEVAGRADVLFAVIDEERRLRTHAAVGDHPLEDRRRGFELVHLVGEVALVEVILQRESVGPEQGLLYIREHELVVVRKHVNPLSGVAQRPQQPQLRDRQPDDEAPVGRGDLPVGHLRTSGDAAHPFARLVRRAVTPFELREHLGRVIRVHPLRDLRHAERTECRRATFYVQVGQHAAQVEHDIFNLLKHFRYLFIISSENTRPKPHAPPLPPLLRGAYF